MKHGKGEQAMSEEEVLEALEVIREALMRTARCFFSCYADCEDAVQECFYKAWSGRESIQHPEYFKHHVKPADLKGYRKADNLRNTLDLSLIHI